MKAYYRILITLGLAVIFISFAILVFDKSLMSFASPGTTIVDDFTDETKIASKTNLVVSGGQVKLAGVCADVSDNTQVPGCDGLCYACQDGICSYALADTDPGNQCSQGSTASDGCATEFCSGIGPACGYQTSGDGGCPVCGTCLGAGSAACEPYFGGTYDNGCSSCKGCSGSEVGSCTGTGLATNWGANLYNCIGSNARCYGGACRTCSGYLYDDGCSGCAGQGGKGCWRTGIAGSCNTICSSYGGCVQANWNDSTTCVVQKAFDPNPTKCAGFCIVNNVWNNYPRYYTYPTQWGCGYRGPQMQNCSDVVGSYYGRVCVCNY